MIWSCPFAFIGLALAPVAFYFIARKARRQYELVEKSFSEDMLARLTRPRSKKLVAFKTVCLFLSLIAFVFVLAGPKSNELETAEFDTLGRDVFVLFDVSDSMMAEASRPTVFQSLNLTSKTYSTPRLATALASLRLPARRKLKYRSQPITSSSAIFSGESTQRQSAWRAPR